MVEITVRSTGRLQDKRDITIVDESGVAVDMTLWGNKARLIDQLNINAAAFPVLLIEGMLIIIIVVTVDLNHYNKYSGMAE